MFDFKSKLSLFHLLDSGLVGICSCVCLFWTCSFPVLLYGSAGWNVIIKSSSVFQQKWNRGSKFNDKSALDSLVPMCFHRFSEQWPDATEQPPSDGPFCTGGLFPKRRGAMASIPEDRGLLIHKTQGPSQGPHLGTLFIRMPHTAAIWCWGSGHHWTCYLTVILLSDWQCVCVCVWVCAGRPFCININPTPYVWLVSGGSWLDKNKIIKWKCVAEELWGEVLKTHLIICCVMGLFKRMLEQMHILHLHFLISSWSSLINYVKMTSLRVHH